MTNYLKLASQFSLVFDLDGTLIDSAPDLHDAVNSILPSYGLRRISIKETQAFIGDGMPNLCEHALEATGGSPEIRQAFCDAFKRAYTDRPAVKTRPMHAVRETLDTAKGAGFAMGVCTNKSEPVAEIILNELSLMSMFDDCIGWIPGRSLKPDPEPLLLCAERIATGDRQAVLVGDSIADVNAARNAGMPCILVRGGYTNTAPESLGADLVVDSFEYLFDALEKLAA
jgi:phosphoglycolate phosphatase